MSNAGKEGKHFRFRKLDFWAQRGLIHVIDERFPPEDDKSYKVITVGEWLRHLQSISAEVKRHALSMYSDERNEYLNLLDNGVEAARQAKAQGRPDDPKAIAEMCRSRRRKFTVGSNQAITLNTVGATGTYEGSLLPPLPNHPAIMAESGLLYVNKSDNKKE